MYYGNRSISFINRESLIVYFVVIVLGIFLVSRKSNRWKRFVLITAAGFIGMVLEIILILLYQNTNGILFRDIGLLLTAFMVGLSLGAFIVNKLFETLKNKTNSRRFIGILLATVFSLLNIIVYLFIKVDLMNNLFIISSMLLFDGICVAGIFSFTSLNNVENQQTIISLLYAADLIGGGLGSIIASLILIPVYGLLTSTLFIAALAVCGTILIIYSS